MYQLLALVTIFISLKAFPYNFANQFKDHRMVTCHSKDSRGQTQVFHVVENIYSAQQYLHSKEYKVTTTTGHSNGNLNNDPLYFLSDDFWGVPGKIVQSQNCLFSNPALVDTHVNTIKTIRIVKEHLGFNSFDNKGAEVISVLLKKGSFNDNARWWDKDKNIITFGQSSDISDHTHLSASIGIVAHEFAHGLLANTIELASEGDQGSLNEAFADIIGVFVCFKNNPSADCYQLGHEAYIGQGNCLRDISNPEQNGQASNFDEYKPNGPNVYYNAGIVTNAFYLLSEGTAEFEGVGYEVATEVFFNAYMKYLNKNSTIRDIKLATVKYLNEAQDLNHKQTLKTLLSVWKHIGP
ncbi:M4 family metallopeptidase [Halobacteriovorax sp. DA5]|uniref:M4 family metallopeptidase n=1 Tax=Halobacteriovorax sp. DA5 TaxID=2067553 RepID=UPI000CD2DC91|nr:M4 family metallopeptidase [Halobacteriovorax sp. DA5]POB14145.1 hypothetical protein C0Z22_08790 [Halobacteriovorax sp. DA5]